MGPGPNTVRAGNNTRTMPWLPDGTFPPQPDNWADEFQDLRRLSTVLRKSWIAKSIIDDYRNDLIIAMRAHLDAIDFERENAIYDRITDQRNTTLCAQTEYLQRNEDSSPEDVQGFGQIIELLNADLSRLKSRLEPHWKLRCLEKKVALLRTYAPYTLHYTVCNVWVTTADAYRRKFGTDMPVEAWPMSPERPIEWFVAELKKLHNRYMQSVLTVQINNAVSDPVGRENAANSLGALFLSGLLDDTAIAEVHAITKRALERQGGDVTSLPELKRRRVEPDPSASPAPVPAPALGSSAANPLDLVGPRGPTLVGAQVTTSDVANAVGLGAARSSRGPNPPTIFQAGIAGSTLRQPGPVQLVRGGSRPFVGA